MRRPKALSGRRRSEAVASVTPSPSPPLPPQRLTGLQVYIAHTHRSPTRPARPRTQLPASRHSIRPPHPPPTRVYLPPSPPTPTDSSALAQQRAHLPSLEPSGLPLCMPAPRTSSHAPSSSPSSPHLRPLRPPAPPASSSAASTRASDARSVIPELIKYVSVSPLDARAKSSEATRHLQP